MDRYNNTELGTFGMLPPELRLCIWDWFFRTPHNHAWFWCKRSNPLKGHKKSILYTSRRLYEEISTRYYETLEVKIITYGSYPKSWISFHIPQFDPHHSSRCLENPSDARQRGYFNFPFHRVRSVCVRLTACESSDPGRLIVLWRNVNQLVDLLSNGQSIRVLRVILGRGPSYAWDENEKEMRMSVKFHSQECVNVIPFLKTERNLYDYEVVLLPFSRMTNVKSFGYDIYCFHWQVVQYVNKTVPSCVKDKVLGLKLPDWPHHPDHWIISKFENTLQFINDIDTCFQWVLLADLPGPTISELYELEWEAALERLRPVKRRRWKRTSRRRNRASVKTGRVGDREKNTNRM